MLERIGRAVDVHQIDQPTMELALQRLVEMGPREPVWTEGYAR